MSGSVMLVTKRVVRVDRSPLNKRVKVALLECGHDLYIHPPAIAPRVGATRPCNACKRAANKRSRR